MESILQQKNVNNVKVSNIIDKVLRQVFGDGATVLIYRYLESNYSIKRNEVAEKIDAFAKGLEEFLATGASVIERKILDDVYSSYGSLRRLEQERTREERDFAGEVKSLLERA